MASVHKEFGKALRAFNAGDVGSAEELCRKALAIGPKHADAASLLAVLCCRDGRLEEGADWAQRAAAAAPKLAQPLEILGDARHQQGRFAEAAQIFAEAIALAPKRGDLWAKRGASLTHAAQFTEALVAYGQAERLSALGAGVLADYGMVLAVDGQAEAAAERLRGAIRGGHRTAHVWACLGDQLATLDREGDAIDAYRQSLALDPRGTAARVNLGLLLMAREEIPAALEQFERAGAEDPGLVEARSSASAALWRLGRFEAAAEAARAAIALAPGHANAHANLGNALLDLGDVAGAIAAHSRAVECSDTQGEMSTNLGLALAAAGRESEAAQALEAGARQAPDAAWPNFNLALFHLARGEWERGWAGYGWRWRTNGLGWVREALDLPQWQGGALSDGRLLVRAEQGVGDEVMFAGLLPRLRARVPALLVECDPRLAPVLARSFPGVDLRRKGDASPLPADVVAQVMAGDLPGLLRPDADGGRPWLPAPYLRADEGRRQALRASYGDGPVIGVAWSSIARATGQARTIALEALRPLFDLPQVSWVSLQYGAAAQAARHVHPRLLVDDRVDQMADLDGFIAQVDAMDAVVTIDNSTAHIAGALAKPGWLLLPVRGDWRWGRPGRDTPWYASLTPVRRQGGQGWEAAIAQVRAAMAAAFPSGQ